MTKIPEDTFKSINKYKSTESQISASDNSEDILGVEGAKKWFCPGTKNDSTIEILHKELADVIIGLPPVARREYMGTDSDVVNRVLATMPICRITPGIPKMVKEGIRLYDFDEEKGRETWQNIVTRCNGNLRKDLEPNLLVAFINEGPISETWQNDYQDSMFESVGNIGIPGIMEARYITGKTELSNVFESLRGRFANLQSTNQATADEAGIFDKILNFGQSIIDTGLQGAGALANKMEKTVEKGGIGETILKMLYGSNIDFPLIWNNSVYMPQYSITVKLVNPFPVSNNAYEKYIIEPLIRLLAFTVPVSDSANTYTYPLLCKVSCPGLFQVKAGFVSSIEVTKGGDGNEIAWTQRPNTVDVRITFGDLYGTMIHFNEEEQENKNQDRPTIKSYIDNLRGVSRFNNPYESVESSLVTTKNSVSYESKSSDLRTTSIMGSTSTTNENIRRVNTDQQNLSEALKELNNYNSLYSTDYLVPKPSESTNVYKSYDSTNQNVDYPIGN